MSLKSFKTYMREAGVADVAGAVAGAAKSERGQAVGSLLKGAAKFAFVPPEMDTSSIQDIKAGAGGLFKAQWNKSLQKRGKAALTNFVSPILQGLFQIHQQKEYGEVAKQYHLENFFTFNTDKQPPNVRGNNLFYLSVEVNNELNRNGYYSSVFPLSFLIYQKASVVSAVAAKTKETETPEAAPVAIGPEEDFWKKSIQALSNNKNLVSGGVILLDKAAQHGIVGAVNGTELVKLLPTQDVVKQFALKNKEYLESTEGGIPKQIEVLHTALNDAGVDVTHVYDKYGKQAEVRILKQFLANNKALPPTNVLLITTAKQQKYIVYIDNNKKTTVYDVRGKALSNPTEQQIVDAANSAGGEETVVKLFNRAPAKKTASPPAPTKKP